jgi:hypothetical protein
MLRLHFKYDYQAAILENQLRAITPELDQLQVLIIGTSIYWGYFTVSHKR